MRIRRRRRAAGALVILLFLLAGCAGEPDGPQDNFYDNGIEPGELPLAPAAADFPRLPFGHADRIVGLAGKDLREKDLRRLSPSFLAALTFDTDTLWPATDYLPPEFDPAQWLAAAQNPGLGLNSLHRQGITGRGVAVAVFDKPLRATHTEFTGRLHYQTVDPEHRKNNVYHFHGIACASILAGATTGVAPEAEVYYFAVPDAGKNFFYYSQALEALVALNASLPAERKVLIVSISDGLSPENADWNIWQAALGRAAAAGIAVLWSNCAELTQFSWGGCPSDLDRDDPESYRPAEMIETLPTGAVIVPGDSRTTAGNGGDEVFVYWGEGGYSWAIPYVAGLAALARQLNPGLSLPEITRLIAETATVKEDGTRLPDPAALIEAIREN